MAEIRNLYEKIQVKTEAVKNFLPEVFEIPQFISDNLKYEFFDWQRDALENLIFYENDKSKLKKNPTHLMFNMATGTGKTLLMAASILFYYNQGYRHFIFFVNQNNIVDKTENNFIDNTHSKYLFKKKIVIDDKIVDIKKVETFTGNTEDIEVKFTTIQKLYNDIHIEKENQVILHDLIKKDIVMLADEAHHLNADTKRKDTQIELDLNVEITFKTGVAEVERKGWEHTVIDLIFNKKGQNENNKNILLEFTATIPENEKVEEKYSDKIIYKFGLKEFLSAGYTKEINLISSAFNKKQRILHALLFNWYREKIALKYYSLGNSSLSNFKPVVLFRSRTIDESKRDYEEFHTLIKSLKVSDFDFLKEIESKVHESKSVYEQGKSRTRDVIEFIKKEGISYSYIIEFIKYNFAEKNCIVTNSKTNTTMTEKTDDEQQLLLNSLEDKDNHIRAIFTVKRLTEGWDVLNLFDIVRLYQGQNTGGSTKKTPQATTEEKQLIGRGVRYYPFSYKSKVKNKRKFDGEMQNDLRILEELYYYTYDEESRYISHLKEELRKEGYIRDNKIEKVFSFKEEFKESTFYKNAIMWTNERIDNPDRKKNTLEIIRKTLLFDYKVKGLEFREEELNLMDEKDIKRLEFLEKTSKTIPVLLKNFEHHIFNKAINIKAKSDKSILQFHKLKQELVIESMEDLRKEEFLGNFSINIIATENMEFDDIGNEEKLFIITKFLDKFVVALRDYINPYNGTEFKPQKMSEIFGEPKVKIIEEDEESKLISKELEKESWYVLYDFHGTSEEKELMNDIKSTITNLKSKFKEVYLLRNEEVYKIFDFGTGRGFQPDFILLLKDKKEETHYYHVFMEPKGDGIKEKDQWKDALLKEITKKYGERDVLTIDTHKYSVIGLPLYNVVDKHLFDVEYEKIWIK